MCTVNLNLKTWVQMGILCIDFEFHKTHITKTCLYNFDPLKPHFYIVKLGFIGVNIIFLSFFFFFYYLFIYYYYYYIIFFQFVVFSFFFSCDNVHHPGQYFQPKTFRDIQLVCSMTPELTFHAKISNGDNQHETQNPALPINQEEILKIVVC